MGSRRRQRAAVSRGRRRGGGDRQERAANRHRLAAHPPDRCLGHHRRAQLSDNLGAIGWTLSLEQIATLDRASEVMPAYPYDPYRTRAGFARLNPPPV